MPYRRKDGLVQTFHTSHSPDQQDLDPRDEPADVTVERYQVSRRPGFSREQREVRFHHSPDRGRDTSPRQHEHSSKSANPHRPDMVLPRKDRYRNEHSDSDSGSDTDGSSPRRVRSRRQYNKDLPVVPTVRMYAEPPHRSRSMGPPRSRSQGPPSPPGPPRRYDSDGNASSSDHHGGKNAQPKPPPKHILYTGLACVATIAALNNVYQSAKAHHIKQRELEEGVITSAEAQKEKMQARKKDLINLGIAAVGAYNVRNGWRRAEGHWKTHRELQAEGRR